MKTLNDHIILYDNECPMCAMYTNAFVKNGMLAKDGRIAFTEASQIMSAYGVYRARACDEIALVNVKNGSVVYGVNSLMAILGNRFPVLQGLFRAKAFRFLISKLYAFISFNRKVIVPGKDMANPNACTPGFSWRYRLLYLFFTWLTTSFILANFTALMVPLIPESNFPREFAICGGQLIFQGIVVRILHRNKVWEYLGNMMTISFAGALLLALVLTFKTILTPSTGAGIFGVVVALMFIEHIRRTQLLGLSWVMTFSWVMYRVLVLAFLL